MNELAIEKPIRLNRYLAQCGLGSRRRCDEIIAAGKVLVNGKPVSQLGTRVDPSHDRIAYQGKELSAVLPLEYLACHKSRGILVTANDPEGRETIYDALEKLGCACRHLKYVGRLDRNSEGLILLTNDGDLIHALTHPRFSIKKTYQVKTDKVLLSAHIRQMCAEGVMSEGQILHAGRIRPFEKSGESGVPWYEVDLYEGKNRQIRRMFETLGYDVIRLRRTQFATIKLSGLSRGNVRSLTPREVCGLVRLGFESGHSRRVAGRGVQFDTAEE